MNNSIACGCSGAGIGICRGRVLESPARAPRLDATETL
jgi:hypothetical protein